MVFDQALTTLSGQIKITDPYPAEHVTEKQLTNSQAKQSAALMRVNHTGEICAQALYHGQSIVSRSETVQQKLQQAAIEEGNHLAWCKQRLNELHSHASYLNPFWYAGSFCIGMVAGMIGDAWSLGFVAETEKQVVKHLDKHLHLLPRDDERSRCILKQMEQDEARHRDEALQLGARILPDPIKIAMSWSSKIMVNVSYWI